MSGGVAHRAPCCQRCHKSWDVAVYHGRGMCGGCYWAEKHAGTLVNWPNYYVKLADVLDDWRAMGRPKPSDDVAKRIGMSRAALERALYRARDRGLLI